MGVEAGLPASGQWPSGSGGAPDRRDWRPGSRGGGSAEPTPEPGRREWRPGAHRLAAGGGAAGIRPEGPEPNPGTGAACAGQAGRETSVGVLRPRAPDMAGRPEANGPEDSGQPPAAAGTQRRRGRRAGLPGGGLKPPEAIPGARGRSPAKPAPRAAGGGGKARGPAASRCRARPKAAAACRLSEISPTAQKGTKPRRQAPSAGDMGRIPGARGRMCPRLLRPSAGKKRGLATALGQ
jgi:hypothetical protein